MHEYQYLVGATLSLSVSMYISTRRHKTLPLKILVLFGLAIAVKEILSFLSMTAPDETASAKLFAVTVAFTRLGYPLYLLTFLNIPEKRETRSLALVTLPVLANLAVVIHPDYLANFMFLWKEFGWTFRTVGFNLFLATDCIVYLGYMAAIVIGLFTLVRKTSFPLLRRKYIVFFASFVGFQVFGILLTNALISLGLLDPVFQLAGIFHFLTFLSIWYALSLKEKKIPLSVMGEEFPQVYSSFLTVYYNSVVGSQLGEETFEFSAFIRKSGIEDHLSLDRNKIAFTETEGLNIGDLVNKNLEIFGRDHVGDEVIDHYLRVLNAAHQILGRRFYEIVKANIDFLTRSDLVYGISNGGFLQEVAEDKSLRDLDDVEACLRIYKRILLPVTGKMQPNTELQKNLVEYHVADIVNISDYGEISIKKFKEGDLGVPKHHLVSLLVERFNSFLSWVYGELLMDPDADVEGILDKLKLVLKLNEERADDLGVYPTLLGMLATKIPKTQIHRLYSHYLEELVEERTRELREAQESLLKSQRLAAIGEAAAMVGHDLRNPLQAIVNTLYLAEKKLDSSSKKDSEELLEAISEQVEYMNKIVSDLQDYARPVKPKPLETDLQKLLNETLSAIRVPGNIRVSVEIEDDVNFPKITVDPQLMKRVFINLIINALQAMPQGGHLTIKASETRDTASISFRDTGVGIPRESLRNLFQPLFTTKAKGQGLGLAVCKRLVEAHQGKITVESELRRGSTFTVKIPSRGNHRNSLLATEHATHL